MEKNLLSFKLRQENILDWFVWVSFIFEKSDVSADIKRYSIIPYTAQRFILINKKCFY